MNILQGHQSNLKNFLKSEHWKSSTWGSPKPRPGNTFYEKIIKVQDSHNHTYNVYIIYFPTDFTAYVTSFQGNGQNPAGHLMCYDIIGLDLDFTWKSEFVATRDTDILLGIEECKKYIQKFILK